MRHNVTSSLSSSLSSSSSPIYRPYERKKSPETSFNETIRVLLEAGAKVDLLDASQKTPLQLARENGYEEGVRILTQKAQKKESDSKAP